MIFVSEANGTEYYSVYNLPTGKVGIVDTISGSVPHVFLFNGPDGKGAFDVGDLVFKQYITGQGITTLTNLRTGRHYLIKADDLVFSFLSVRLPAKGTKIVVEF